MKIVGTTIKESSSVQSDFCTKLLFCGHHQNLNSIVRQVLTEKEFSKSMSSYKFKNLFVKSGFAVVPTN
ncbi:hypothetical protein [Leptospira kirschneri]|uniref:hypothetical protein n=1 Tax=Leptospira kirschneri TaxID=29507 RepID=UPI0002C01636|nr:hypothetical protein [Leptospira kirschneri]EMO75798.1 hypothetical protein LEP1GSC127_1177 [Leptospira kirschneri str. 200801925]OOV46229.1 hypothetical protein B1J94_18320 [Leptospira kirschneri serovar Grippotyphosa]UZW35395.1 hypothetical protein ORQ95_12055 [Leptospira kirschneri]WBF93769.1 hypothetical protein LIX31_12270 [Leptospira kirschneri]WHO99102.1 hypothetical protein QMK36_12065 [Leptospira kirschneri]